MDHFTAWMAGLDAVEVAKTNSFHSRTHREMVIEHEHYAKMLKFLKRPTKEEVLEVIRERKTTLTEAQRKYVNKVAQQIIKQKENTNVR